MLQNLVLGNENNAVKDMAHDLLSRQNLDDTYLTLDPTHRPSFAGCCFQSSNPRLPLE